MLLVPVVIDDLDHDVTGPAAIQKKKTSMSKEVNRWSKAIRPLFFKFFTHSRPCAIVLFFSFYLELNSL